MVPNSLLYLFFTLKPENICRAPICALHRVEQWRKLGAKRIGTLVHYCSQRDPAFKMKLAPISISLFITFAHTFTFLLFVFENWGICSKRPLKKKLPPISLWLSLYCFFCGCFFSFSSNKSTERVGAMEIETFQNIGNIGKCYHVTSSANNLLITKMLFPSERNDSMQVGTGLPLS